MIEQVGPGVTRFGLGQRVVVSFGIACGACWFCRKGQTQLCEEFGFLGYGMFGGSLGRAGGAAPRPGGRRQPAGRASKVSRTTARSSSVTP